MKRNFDDIVDCSGEGENTCIKIELLFTIDGLRSNWEIAENVCGIMNQCCFICVE
jgi:hypothetical protein